jgi:GWxTD domain-containing protein
LRVRSSGMKASLLLAALVLSFWAGVGGGVEFDVDWAAFRGQGDSSRLEFFYSIPYAQLDYVAGEDGIVARYSVRFSIEGSGFEREATLFKQAVLDSFRGAQETGLRFRDAFSVMVPPGRYRARAVLAKPAGAALDTLEDREVFVEAGGWEDSVTVPDFKHGLQMSTIQLASGVVVHQDGGYTVLPNPTRRFGESADTQLFFYFEGYNLSLRPDSFLVGTVIATPGPKPETLVYTAPSAKVKSGTDVSSVLGMSMADLEAGDYVLSVRITDIGLGRTTERQAGFTIAASAADDGSTPMRLSDLTQLEREYYRDLEYVATPLELQHYNALGDSSKEEQYLAWFWGRRGRASLAEFARRMETAKLRYSTARTSGIREDRGRIYVRYGEPDEVQRAVIEVDRRPREYWRYYGLGYTFVFIDLRADNIYRLAWTDCPDIPVTGYERYLTEDELETFR